MYDDMQTSMNTKAGFNGNISVEAKTWSLSGDANKGLKVADMGKFLMENNLGGAIINDGTIRVNCVLTTFKSQMIYVKCDSSSFVVGEPVYCNSSGLATSSGTIIAGYVLAGTELDNDGTTKIIKIRINL
jgi:hypothetical protein